MVARTRDRGSGFQSLNSHIRHKWPVYERHVEFLMMCRVCNGLIELWFLGLYAHVKDVGASLICGMRRGLRGAHLIILLFHVERLGLR